MFKGSLFYKLENVTYNMAPQIRKMGREWFNKGMEMQGPMAHKDTMQPSLRNIAISNDKYPQTIDSDWVAPNAVVIGDV